MINFKSTATYLKQWWGRKYYNRLFIFSAVVFVAVIYSFGLFAAILSTQLNMEKNQQKYTEVLAAICDEYDRKHDNFYNIILPLYNSTDSYMTLSDILEGTADDRQLNNAYFKQKVVNIMHSLSIQDRDIVAILLRRQSDGANFLYSAKGKSFSQVFDNLPLFDKLKLKDPYGRAIYGVSRWGKSTQLPPTYGIAGVLGSSKIHSNAGSIMVAYDVAGLQKTYQKHLVSSTAKFYIVSSHGEIIYDSSMASYGQSFPNMDLVSQNGKTVMVDGVKTIVLSINHANRGYYGICLEPDTTISQAIIHDNLLIFAVCTGISLVAALLYMITGIISTRRLHEIDQAMAKIGSNNLSYRVPLSKRKDELAHIATRFNMMCDRLEDNINKLYINEIKQKNAELHALQSGINPHFLYNTLEAIRGKAQQDGNADVADFIVQMANLLRSLVRSQTFVPIHQEIAFSRMYLDMFSLRYSDHFEYEIKIDSSIYDYGVPKGILQPVLENYFIHGIREDAYDNHLQISGICRNDLIVFIIEDNGKGITNAKLDEIRSSLYASDAAHNSYGLANVHDRIKLVYGSDCGISIDSNLSINRTIVSVTIKALTCEELQKSISVHSAASDEESKAGASGTQHPAPASHERFTELT